ncbi:MAG TPA: KUP/HAK/KT family potassium transporter [Rhizomicrobium sp.]|nr:KUP/HAK/KT family potassium transporter [Rhizomicrobium sp.]
MSVADAAADKRDSRPEISGTLGALSIQALGIVFGDIATSPLYTLKTVLDVTGAHPDAAAVLGSLSLIFWTLVIITSIKYINIAMRIDNDGEGGILALMSLITSGKSKRPLIVACGLFGAALIYGDGAITPAISVLSALEGLDLVSKGFQPYVLPCSVLILLALFFVQRQGTAKIGGAFGPIMLIWLLAIALLGVHGILAHPAVLVAINPAYGISYLLHGGITSFLVLGGVFLCVTGAEALYADMGHFGPRPIRLSWTAVVLPALVLNYAGQAAVVLSGAPTAGNIFYQLCPEAYRVPLIILATLATIIASQSIITGAFSMTRQAIQLGWLPRLPITQTSAHGYGQIYVGPVNWLLALATLGLVFGFRSSDNLASAYGVAVSGTMLLTSFLLFRAIHEVWKWSLALSLLVMAPLAFIDASFLTANLAKVLSGGYVPVLLALTVYAAMQVWHTGTEAVHERIASALTPLDDFIARIEKEGIPRVPGTAVFLTRAQSQTPPVMEWYVKHARALHRHVFILCVQTQPTPWSRYVDRLKMEYFASGFSRGVARFGFMERPDVPALLREAVLDGCRLDLEDVTFFVGHETIVARGPGMGLPRPVEAAFAFMQRNAAHATDYFRVPHNAVVEIGREIAI